MVKRWSPSLGSVPKTTVRQHLGLISDGATLVVDVGTGARVRTGVGPERRGGGGSGGGDSGGGVGGGGECVSASARWHHPARAAAIEVATPLAAAHGAPVPSKIVPPGGGRSVQL